jgi:hypothetical protein
MVYGEEVVLQGQVTCAASHVAERPAPQQQAEQALEIPLRARSYAEAAKGPLDSLARAEFVYIRKGGAGGPTQPVYEGPYKVLERRTHTFLVEMGERHKAVAISRLKPHVGSTPDEVAQPARRGRPPGTGGEMDSSGASSRGGS